MLSPPVKGGIEKLVAAATRCLEVPEPLIVPGISLIYIAIDTLAQLETRTGKIHERFEGWVDRYLMLALRAKPTFPDGLRKEDLWSARCGVLHEYSSMSDRTRGKKARPVYYVTRDGTEEWRPRQLKTGDGHALVVEDLFEAFKDAVVSFEAAVASDPVLEKQVEAKGADMFSRAYNAVPVGGVYRITGNRVMAEVRRATGGASRPEK